MGAKEFAFVCQLQLSFWDKVQKNKKHKVKSEKIYKRKTRRNVAKLLANIEFATYSTHMSHRNGGSCRE